MTVKLIWRRERSPKEPEFIFRPLVKININKKEEFEKKTHEDTWEVGRKKKMKKKMNEGPIFQVKEVSPFRLD